MEGLPRCNNGGEVGLLCHYLLEDGSCQCVVLDVHDGFGNGVLVNKLYSFCTNFNVHICAVCNHVLLLATFAANSLTYHVYDVFARQCVALPPSKVTRRSIRTGLALDGLHYQVVRVFRVEADGSAAGDGLLEMEIFSSETGAWSDCRPGIRLPSRSWDLPKLGSTPLFLDRAIHWEFGSYMLSYHVDDGGCRLIELPYYSLNGLPCRTMTFGQCLWESEGLLHYCYSDFEGTHIWVLTNKEHKNPRDLQFHTYDHHGNDHSGSCSWKLVRSIGHEALVSCNPDIFRIIARLNDHCFSLQPCHITPCGYSPTSNAIYLRLPGVVASYNLGTNVLNVVCTFKAPGQNFYCCSVFPIKNCSPLPVVKNVGSSGGEQQFVHLPLPDLAVKDNCR